MLAGLVIWTLVASALTAILYAWDKRAAIKDRRRVAEKTLLLCSLVGGWPGGIAAGQLLRHKTRKVSYRIAFACCVIANIAAVVGLVMSTR